MFIHTAHVGRVVEESASRAVAAAGIGVAGEGRSGVGRRGFARLAQGFGAGGHVDDGMTRSFGAPSDPPCRRGHAAADGRAGRVVTLRELVRAGGGPGCGVDGQHRLRVGGPVVAETTDAADPGPAGPGVRVPEARVPSTRWSRSRSC